MLVVDIIQRKSKEIIKLCTTRPVTFLAVFGSYARNEHTPVSDIDVLIDYTREMSYFDMCDFRDDLEFLLEKKIDLVPRKHLKTSIQASVYEDLKVLYEK